MNKVVRLLIVSLLSFWSCYEVQATHLRIGENAHCTISSDDYYVNNHSAFKDDDQPVKNVVRSFYGIPYTKQWSAHHRFESPDSYELGGNIPCSTPRPLCHQSEDCLYLNIFSPHSHENHDARYPVIFFIPGKSYTSDTNDVFDGRLLASLGVIVVTVNYRMGVLGHLTLEDDELPGNYGLQDVTIALKWVHTHIEYFKGLKNEITVIGHGSGAVYAAILLAKSSFQDIIHAGVLLSGSVLSEYEYYNRSGQNYYKLVNTLNENFNCFSDQWSSSSLKACLKSYPFEKFFSESMLNLDVRPWVDGRNFPKSPHMKFHDVPVYIGMVENEFGNDIEAKVNTDEMWQRIKEKDPTVYELIKRRYTDWMNRTNVNEKELYGDIAITLPCLRLADEVSRYNDKVYFYNLQHENAFHGFELNYLFGVPFGMNLSRVYDRDLKVPGSKYFRDSRLDSERKLSKQFMNFIFSIANNSQPGQIGGVEWPKYNETTRDYLTISPHVIQKSQNPFAEKRTFWEEMVPDMEENLKHRTNKDEDKTDKRLAIILAACLGVVGSIAFVLAALAIWYHIKVGHLKNIIDMNALA